MAAKDAKADGKTAKAAPKAADKPADKPADKAAAKADPPPASSSPMAELKRSNEKLDKILQKNRPDWSPEAELQRAEVRKLVGSFLDYGELAKRALARHWEGLAVKQREEFVNTLRELVERSCRADSAANSVRYSANEMTRRLRAKLSRISPEVSDSQPLESKMRAPSEDAAPSVAGPRRSRSRSPIVAPR